MGFVRREGEFDAMYMPEKGCDRLSEVRTQLALRRRARAKYGRLENESIRFAQLLVPFAFSLSSILTHFYVKRRSA